VQLDQSALRISDCFDSRTAKRTSAYFDPRTTERTSAYFDSRTTERTSTYFEPRTTERNSTKIGTYVWPQLSRRGHPRSNKKETDLLTAFMPMQLRSKKEDEMLKYY